MIATALLCCPVCNAGLTEGNNDSLRCVSPSCNISYPIVNGVPVLIDESRSLFRIDDFSRHSKPSFFRSQSRIGSVGSSIMPSLSRNLVAERNFRKIQSLITHRLAPVILVIGSGLEGDGIRSLRTDGSTIIRSDISWTASNDLICDAHALPFPAASVDVVIAQAVLEHVLDPSQCVSEIWRVLKPEGILYSEIPFMQQVHGREYDFTRFTQLGQRRLFNHYKEIDSGICCGPGMALAWSWEYFLLSFTQNTILKYGLKTFARLTAFWLLYFDAFLQSRPGSLDAASGLYFLGSKATDKVSDEAIIRSYQGANS